MKERVHTTLSVSLTSPLDFVSDSVLYTYDGFIREVVKVYCHRFLPIAIHRLPIISSDMY